MRNNTLILTTIAIILCALFPSRLEAEDQTTSAAATFEYVGSFGGTISAVRNVGAYTYVGQGSVLRVFKSADCNDRYPKEIAHLKMEEPITYIDSHGPALLVLTENSLQTTPPKIVHLVDIKDVSKPKIVKLGDSSNYVYRSINGNEIYVVNGRSHLFDISNPLKPSLIMSGNEADARARDFPRWNLKENDRFKCDLLAPDAYDVRIQGKIAYLLAPCSLTLVDVSSPDSPQYVSQLSMDTTTTAFDSSDKYLAIADKRNFVRIYGLSNPLKPTFIKSIPVNIDIEKKFGKDIVVEINEMQIQDNYLGVLLDRESGLVYVYDVSSTLSQPVDITNERSPYKYKSLYKTGFGQLLKYRILKNKYWFGMDFYQPPNSDTYRPELDAIGLDPKSGMETKAIARIAYGRMAFYERIMVEGNKIYAGWWIGDSQVNTEGIQLIVYTPKGFIDRGSHELPEGQANYFVQGDIVYTISQGNSLIMYKIR